MGLLTLTPAAPQARTRPALLKKSGPLRDARVAIPHLKTTAAYALLFSVQSRKAFGPDSRISVDVMQGAGELLHKTLHGGDPDFFALFRVPRDGPAELRIAVVSPMTAPATYRLEISRWIHTREPAAPVASAPPSRAGGGF